MKIAFGYKMGSGKDTAVDYLIKKHGGQKIAFSDPLYDILHYAQQKCNFPLEKDRKFLQWIGTEWARNQNDNVWIDYLLNNSSTAENIFVSDVRFINEFKALKNNGWTCVKINRNLNISTSIATNTHQSEIDLDQLTDDHWDVVIDNNGTIEEFYEKINLLVKN